MLVVGEGVHPVRIGTWLREFPTFPTFFCLATALDVGSAHGPPMIQSSAHYSHLTSAEGSWKKQQQAKMVITHITSLRMDTPNRDR